MIIHLGAPAPPATLVADRARRAIAAALLAMTTLLLVGAGCGASVSFIEAEGAANYKRLSSRQAVETYSDLSEVKTAYEVLGELTMVSEEGQKADDAATVAGVFEKYAARKGCDAVVGLKNDDVETQEQQRKKVGVDKGKVIYEKVMVTVVKHLWTAKCVRTAAAPGGLQSAQGVAAAAPPTPPTPPAAPLTPPAPPTPPAATVGPPPTPPAPPAGSGAPPIPGPPSTTPPATTPPPAGPPPTTAPELTPPPVEPPPAAPAALPVLTPQATALWKQLATYDATWLAPAKDRLATPAKRTVDVLDALRLLIKEVAGPAGFWRKLVPEKWFGCTSSPDSKACKQLAGANRELEAWDAVDAVIGQQTEATASQWLQSNHAEVQRFLSDYVPPKPDLTAAQATPFFKKHFQL